MHNAQSTPRAAAWAALERHVAEVRAASLSSMFEADPARAEAFAADACGLHVDYSKQRLLPRSRELLLDLARACEFERWRQRLFDGDTVNVTEGRAALHTALRWRGDAAFPSAQADVMPQVRAVQARMRRFSEAVRSGSWRGYSGEPIEDVVNVGIGGSDLGPAMVCRALSVHGHERLRCHFVSNLDANHLQGVLAACDPRRTLFIVASKTFTTQETLTNAHSAKAWLLAQAPQEAAVARHFVALSTQRELCERFGIDGEHVFEFWDWVGGRYSLWSAIGLSMAVYLGMDVFEALLDGGHAMDLHFRDAPLARNLPVLMGLVDVWNRNLHGHATRAVLPYDHALELLPAFLQQLEMESNGKSVDRAGEPLARASCAVVWGALGSNGQHAFYQLLHQGTQVVPAEFIVPVFGQRPLPGHQDAVLANALAQAEALMRGRGEDEVRAALAGQGLEGEALEGAVPHRLMAGNRPSTIVLYERLTPQLLGALVALYEHKVFVQSVCWDVNPFDQWGVELGKQLARSLEPALRGDGEAAEHDPSTQALIRRIRALRARAPGG